MDLKLLSYFKCDNKDVALEKLSKTIKLKSQTDLYDYIYIDFMEKFH